MTSRSTAHRERIADRQQRALRPSARGWKCGARPPRSIDASAGLPRGPVEKRSASGARLTRRPRNRPQRRVRRDEAHAIALEVNRAARSRSSSESASAPRAGRSSAMRQISTRAMRRGIGDPATRSQCYTRRSRWRWPRIRFFIQGILARSGTNYLHEAAPAAPRLLHHRPDGRKISF